MGLEAAELARWTRFAAKGGIGKCTATCDCVAESADDLMFLKDDEITVLLQLPDKEGFYLGYCEGVVGRFSGADVQFHSKLKKPVMTKRSSSHSRSSKSQAAMSGLSKSPPPSSITSATNAHSNTPPVTSGRSTVIDDFSGSSSRSQTPIAQSSPSSSAMNSPTTSTFSRASSSAGLRNSTSDAQRTAGNRFGSLGSRDFHFPSKSNDGNEVNVSDPTSLQSFSALGVAPPFSTTESSSSSIPPPQNRQPTPPSSPPMSSPKKLSHVPSPLNLESPKEEGSRKTAPLRITKRVPGSPSVEGSVSPRSPSFNLSSKSSIASLVSDEMLQLSAVVEPPLPAQAVPLGRNSQLEATLPSIHTEDEPNYGQLTPPHTAPPSALDTSITMDSTYDDLEKNHPGRFSRFSMGPSLAMSNLLSMMDQSPASRPPTSDPTEVSGELNDVTTTLAAAPTINGHIQRPTSLSEAARGKVDEATLASTQAQVGIGLSLLQDLVGGMGSDSDSDSEYDESPKKPTWTHNGSASPIIDSRTGSVVLGPGTNQHAHGARVSLATSEDSTVEGLAYGSTDDDHDGSPGSQHFGPPVGPGDEDPVTPLFGPPEHLREQQTTLLSPPTSPTTPSTPFTPKSFDDSSPFANFIERERRPSLAHSVVSGSGASVSARSGTSSSWDADIYDNYRYSRFSMANGGVGAGRPSMDSVRARTDSGGQSNRKRSESASTGLGQSVVSADQVLEGLPPLSTRDALDGLNQTTHVRDISVASATSVYTQNSRLSTLSTDVASLTQNGPEATAHMSSRPPPLSLHQDTDTPYTAPLRSPLLHTDWSSPAPPVTGSLQTSLPPLSSVPETPRPGVFVAEESVKYGLSPQSQNGLEAQLDTNGKANLGPGAPGLASTLRQRLETDRKSSLPQSAEGIDEGRIQPTTEKHSQIDETSFNGDIVAEDSEELPSKLDIVDDEVPEYDEDDTFVDERRLAESPSPDRKLSRDSVSPEPETTLGRLAPLIITNRTPSPAGRDDDDEDLTLPRVSSQPAASDLPMATPPPGLSTEEPTASASHLRTRTLAPNLQGRRSIFLPHPNAPKLLTSPPASTTTSTSGPIPPVQHHPPQPHPPYPAGPPLRRPPVQEIIRIALSSRPRILQGPPGRPPIQLGPTIFGQTDLDLFNSIGPVPISFTVEPRPGGHMIPRATAPGGVLPPIGAGGPGADGPTSQMPRQRSTLAQPTPQRAALPLHADDLLGPSSTTLSNPQVINPPNAASSSGTTPLPRSNFIPKIPGHRPRSRSFSGFNTSAAESKSPSTSESSQGDTTTRTPKRTLSSSVSTGSLTGSNTKPLVKSSPLRPSPLALSAISLNTQEREIAAQPPTESPKSPIVPKSPTSPTRPSTLRSNVILSPPSPAASTFPPLSNSIASLPSSSSESAPLSPEPATPTSPGALSTMPTSGRSSGLAQRASLKAKTSRATLSDAIPARRSSKAQAGPPDPNLLEDPSLKSQGHTSSNGGSSIARQSSLRAKLSLPNLRKVRNRSEDDTDPSLGIYDRVKDPRATFEQDRDPPGESAMAKELVQVQDMEFEFVRPNLAQLQLQARASSESSAPRREGSLDSRGDHFLRADSPAASLLSSGPRSPVVDMAPSPSTSMAVSTITQASIDSSVSIEAHRQREGKWVSLMSSSPAALSRKSKKVKKLLLEGVPSSVRYLIWSYLTDGKGRAVKGVYEQLCKRGEVSKTDEISTDVSRLGEDATEHFIGVKGTIVVLLQAYFAMVPDVQYSLGLVKIAGQLLVLAPEEDAFWIFTSIMDTHIRAYFSFATPNPPSSSLDATSSPRSTQLEVDASLYARALENNDSTLSKKLFVDLGIPPGVICQPWLTSLFVGTLPADYVQRIWDIFLYEGVPFLLRVALALTLACRRFIITAKTDSQALMLLARPPASTHPSTPEALLTSALSVKLKDDDVRKQRLKMGNIVKRQTQASQTGVGQNGISLPRS